MKKRLMLCLAFILPLLVPPPAHAQANLQADVAAARTHYPTPMSAAQQAAVINDVAWKHRAEGWGLLSKPSGNNCPQPVSGAPVACDILFHLPSGHHFDVLGDTGGAGTPQWGDAGEMDRNRFIVPVDPGDGNPPPPPPPPPATDAATADLQSQQLLAMVQILNRLDELQQAMAKQSDAQTAALSQAIKDLKTEIAKGIKVRF